MIGPNTPPAGNFGYLGRLAEQCGLPRSELEHAQAVVLEMLGRAPANDPRMVLLAAVLLAIQDLRRTRDRWKHTVGGR